KKKLIICCDGTGKSGILPESLTNVSIISRCIKACDDKNIPQVVYYQPGVRLLPLTRRLFELHPYLNSLGIDENIMEAYSFICNNYCEKSDDEIYLIGYSRDAFTVRCIARLIHDIGLLRKAGLIHLRRLF
ncbi:Uncharacterized alpha/beta hydrolase domain (DUF2235) domain containing protein, partial [Elaphomyces granulatus]